MRSRLRSIMVSVVLCGCVSVFCRAGDADAKGPRVEITPADGRGSYSACLLSFKDGLLDVQLDDGESHQERVAEVRSIRFVPATNGSSGAIAPPAPDGKIPLWNEADGRRLRELGDREAHAQLAPGETDELRVLRDRAPQLLLRAEAFKRRVVVEAARANTDVLQRRLKDATQEDDARLSLWALAHKYAQSGSVGPKLKEVLQRDVDSITNPDVRKKTAGELDHVLNWIAAPKPWRKDRDKDRPKDK